MRRARVEIEVEALERNVLDGVRGSDDPNAPRVRADVGVVPWFEDERPFRGLLGLLDWRSDGALSALARDGFCRGSRGESVLLPGGSGLPVERLVLVGGGCGQALDESGALELGERAVRVAAGLRPTSVLLAMPSAGDRDRVESVFLGALRGLETMAPTDPVEVMTTPPHRWWMLAEDRHVARLRRLLDGPLRAAAESSSSS